MSYHIKYLSITKALGSAKKFVSEKLGVSSSILYTIIFFFCFIYFQILFSFLIEAYTCLKLSLLLHWPPPIYFAKQFLTYFYELTACKEHLNVVWKFLFTNKSIVVR